MKSRDTQIIEEEKSWFFGIIEIIVLIIFFKGARQEKYKKGVKFNITELFDSTTIRCEVQLHGQSSYSKTIHITVFDAGMTFLIDLFYILRMCLYPVTQCFDIIKIKPNKVCVFLLLDLLSIFKFKIKNIKREDE